MYIFRRKRELILLAGIVCLLGIIGYMVYKYKHCEPKSAVGKVNPLGKSNSLGAKINENGQRDSYGTELPETNVTDLMSGLVTNISNFENYEPLTNENDINYETDLSNF